MRTRMRSVLASSWAACLIITAAITLPGFAQSTCPTADFYVAPNGNDSSPGTLLQPFKTVDHARVAVENLKAHVSGRTITVVIRNGTYYLPSTWTFTDMDSGTPTTPILYTNCKNETPVISGGQLLTGFTQTSQGYWQKDLPAGTYFTQLWVNGSRRYVPRTTPGGYLYITAEYSTTGSTTTVNEFSYTTKAANGVPAKMSNLGDVDLIVFEAWDVPHMRISSVNTTTKRIVTTSSLEKQSFFHGFIPGHRFLLANVKEALNQPGEFYVDRPTAVLTYIPEKGESISTATIVAPHLQTILQASNLSYVTFQGLTFAHSDWQVPKGGYGSGQGDLGATAALNLTNSTGVVFEADTIEHTGGYGINFQGTGTAGTTLPYLVQFQDGMLTDLGAGGIRVGGEGNSVSATGRCSGSHTDANVPQHIYIGDNLITGGGRIAAVGWAVDIGDAHHVVVEHNEISDFYNVGVGVGFNWGYTCNFAHNNWVQYNHIHNLGQGVTSDLGAVYFLTGLTAGNAIQNNWVHDLVQDPVGYGAWGLYLDAGSSEVLIQNNLVYRTTDASLHVNQWDQTPAQEGVATPTPNTFKNNILAYGAMGAMDRHNDVNFLSVVYENNIFYFDKASPQYGYWYCEGKTICTSYFDFNNNLYYDKSVSGGRPAQPFFKTPKFTANGGQQPPKTLLTFAQWQAEGEDKQSLFANPLFANPTPGVDNFSLSSNSPAFSVGFVSFNPASAGRLPGATLTAPTNAPGYPPQIPAIMSF